MRPTLRPQPRPSSPLEAQKRRLLEELRGQGIRDERVLTALGKVPREDFIEEALRSRAYENNALPIGQSQTISQPYVVALMTQAVIAGDVAASGAVSGTRKLRKVLEIGTGCGYQTAVLAEVVPAVFTIERIKRLSEQARERLARLGYHRIHFSYADGNAGWPTYAPFDGILVTAAAADIPQPLIDQLAPGGRLIIPVGPLGFQYLKMIERTEQGTRTVNLCGVSFVPLLGGRA
jgi:protein-L-isoaspartate(D-aspartate) O-methyltransferase